MLLPINDRSIMGDYVNSKLYNVVAWATAIGCGLLSLILGFISLLPQS